MYKKRKIFKYQIKNKVYYSRNIVNKCVVVIEKKDYYKESINALICYMEKNEKNPSEQRWNHYAIEEKLLSGKSMGYLSGIGFNTLCRKIRKEINKKKKQF